MAARSVYSFDHAHMKTDAELRDLLGGKGFSLWLMKGRLGLPVPPGFSVGTDECVGFSAGEGRLDDDLKQAIRTHLKSLEAEIGKSFGAGASPMLLSVRSGAPASMPGMMDTLLNIGMTPANTEALARQTGSADFAWGSYRRMLRSFAELVLGMDVKGEADEAHREDPRRSALALRALIAHKIGEAQIDDPEYQLFAGVETVFRSWNSPRAVSYRKRTGMSDAGGTAVNIQAMVFGNLDARSGTGVAFTRDPSTGAPGLCGDFLLQAQGDDVVSGDSRTQPLTDLREVMPDCYAALQAAADTLEMHMRDLVDIEFTIESGRLWMLQARVGKRSPAAAPRIAVDLVNEGRFGLTRREVLSRIDPEILNGSLAAGKVSKGGAAIAKGLAVSPGLASGRIVFNPDRAVDLADEGEDVILVRRETSPEDVHGMGVARGIITTMGGMMSHAAVVARAWGIPAVCSVEGVELMGDAMICGGKTYVEGDVLSLDGSSGDVFEGEIGSEEKSDPFLQVLLEWASEEKLSA